MELARVCVMIQDHLILTLGNTLYPLKVSGKPVSEEEHTVTLFYAVPVSVEGTVTQVTSYYDRVVMNIFIVSHRSSGAGGGLS